MKALLQSFPRANAVWFWLPLAVFFTAVVTDIELPGLYMDAINPDYMVPRMLGSTALNSIWIMPGNLVLDRWPLLPSLYHGSGMAWIGLPFYALLGTDIFAVRLVHGMYGGLILAGGLMLLHRLGVWQWLVGLVGLAIALDPSFIFSFRTQFYINAAPMVLVICAIYLLHTGRVESKRRSMFWSGLLLGLAIFGYFIYAFFVPAMAIAVYFWCHDRHTRLVDDLNVRGGYPALLVWSAGLFVGLLPYAVGFVLMAINKGSFASFFEYVASLLNGLQVAKAHTDSMGRFEAVWTYFLGLVNHTAQSGYWTTGVQSQQGGVVKAVGLALLPPVLLLVAELRGTATRASRLLIGLSASFFLAASIFGARLGSHHFGPVMILLYLALSQTLFDALRSKLVPNWLSEQRDVNKGQLIAVSTLVLVCAYNLHAQLVSRDQLRQTGGTGLYSDAINRFAADINANHRSAIHFMPDWGIWMPTVFLTGGKVDIVGDENFKHARWLLCQNREARWVFVEGNRKERIESVTTRLDWDPPEVTSWRQRDGKVVFDVATFMPSRPSESGRCKPSV